MTNKYSKIRLGVAQGNKHYLKDVESPQMQWVTINISHPENGRIMEIEMSMTQFSQMLATNSEVSCTIKSMYDKKGNRIEEIAEEPQSVQETLSENLNKNKENISNRIDDLCEDLNQLIESKSVSKKKLREALHELKIISSHHESNSEFYLKEAKSKIEEINNEKKTQIINLIDQGKDLKPIKKILTLETPLIENYKEKENKETNIDLMNKRELAREIDNILKNFKEKSKNLFEPNAQESKKGIRIVYMSYQGSSTLSVDEAKEYLKALKKMKSFQQHFQVIQK